MENWNLTEKEQEFLLLHIVKECIAYATEKDKSFEAVLNEDLFAQEANLGFAEFICKGIASLYDKKYIEGEVELTYESNYSTENGEVVEEVGNSDIEFDMCTFANISITDKGKFVMRMDNYMDVGKELAQKSKPIIKCIVTTALQTAVEVSVKTALGSVGIQA